MREIRLRALAKINLALDVLGKREDGYHEVRMVMQTLNIFDKLNVRVTREPGIRIVTNLSYLPVNENNLVYKAARMMMEEFEILEGLSIDLYKYIPVAAGMAGGSSDAAAVIFAMNKLFRLGLTLDKMMDRGVKIGADVPYCLMRGTALAEGIGERLTRLPACPPCFVLVAKPPVNVSTKFVYGNLKADELTYHPDVDGFIEAMADGYRSVISCDRPAETVYAGARRHRRDDERQRPHRIWFIHRSDGGQADILRIEKEPHGSGRLFERCL